MAEPRRRRRRRTPAASTTQRGKPLFEKEGDNIIPGEALVQLQEDVATQITSSIPIGPSRGIERAGAASFGVTAIDRILADLHVTSIARLHPPPSPVTAGMEAAVKVASTFRIRFESTVAVERAVERLNNAAEVEFAEPNVYRETSVVPNDPSYPIQWGLARINCPAAWDRTTGAANVIVGVLDTGIDLDHPELLPLLLPGQDMVDLGLNPTPPAGFRFEGDFAGRDNDPQDEVGHGTHVAGTIACLSNNGVGVAGVTWNCRLLPVKVLTRIVNISDPSDVRGIGSSADIAAGIRWAVDNGARVLNMSLSGPQNTQVERDAVAYAISRGAVVVAAMGNNGNNTPRFPAAFPDVVAVGAIDQSDSRAAFSNMGPHIDVAAPGVGVLSTVWDNGYATFQGTSMASPHVAGVAALILSCNANLTGPQAADIIRRTARPLRDNPADPVPNDRYGHGCVDAKAAIDQACPQPSRPILQCPSQSLQCPSGPVRCPSVAVRCPSVTIRCPSQTVQCASGPVRCPSQTVACPSISIQCPSETIRCPSQNISCPSIAIRCPSGPVCGIGPLPQPGQPFHASAWDPYATYGYGYAPDYETDEMSAYDPYATWYGGDPTKT